jgi:hypothetical protein
MNKRKHNLFNHEIYIQSGIIISFAVLAIISGLLLMWHHSVGIGYDLFFHWQRIYELRKSIENSNFYPLVALNQFQQNGNAIMAMYPKMNLYPIVFLSFFIKNFVNLVYVSFILKTFLGLIIAYYACLSFKHDSKISFIFSIGYNISAMTLFQSFQAMDLGISSSMLFWPLVLFGTLNWLKNNHYRELAVGLGAIMLCHVISAIMAIGLIIIFAVINYKVTHRLSKLFALLKAILIASLLASSFLIPFILLSMQNTISLPQSFNNLSGDNILHILGAAFDNGINPGITIIAVLGLAISIVRYKDLDYYNKQILWISIGIIIICSYFFPWNILNNTFIKESFQFSWRLFIIPQLLLSYLFAANIFKLCKNNSQTVLAILSITIAVIMIQLTSQQTLIDSQNNNHNLTTPYTDIIQANITSNKEFNNIIHGNSAGMTDYYPQKLANTVINGNRNVNTNLGTSNNKQLKVELLGNGQFTFSNQHTIKKLHFPFIIYHGLQYQIKIDGKEVPNTIDHNQLLTLNNVPRGSHHLQITIQQSEINIVSVILTSLGIIILIVSLFIPKYNAVHLKS